MTAVEIKTNLHQLIDREEDIHLLTKIQGILSENSFSIELSDEEKEAIEEGLEQLDNGKGVSHNMVIEMFRKEFSYGS